MPMLKKILLLLVAAIAGLAVYVAMQPDHFRIERRATVNAPPQTVFIQVNDFRKWDDWSPWAKLDPNVKVTGPQSGPGATFMWDGNDKVGAGTMTITESRPNQHIATRTDFTRPFEGTSNADFVFSEAGGQTNVIWSMFGKQRFIGKAICLFTPMGKMLERGLAQLKRVAEKQVKLLSHTLYGNVYI
jgi:uncharacterized protein YndB with AHSA1/START domain